MPPINRQFDMVHADEWSMKVAFASSDYRHVDQHFGATPRLVVFDRPGPWPAVALLGVGVIIIVGWRFKL